MDEKVHTLPNIVSLKVNVIASLEFEHINYDVLIQHANHYVTWVLILFW